MVAGVVGVVGVVGVSMSTGIRGESVDVGNPVHVLHPLIPAVLVLLEFPKQCEQFKTMVAGDADLPPDVGVGVGV